MGTYRQVCPYFHWLRRQLVYAILKQKVRKLVGILVACGKGKMRANDIPELILAKDRKKSPPTAPPQGLTMTRIWYKDE